MKKRLIFILAASVILTFQSNAQLLWKISGNGLEKPSYLFGTHHVAPIHICDSIAGFNEAFNSCKQLYGELELDDKPYQKKLLNIRCYPKTACSINYILRKNIN